VVLISGVPEDRAVGELQAGGPGRQDPAVPPLPPPLHKENAIGSARTHPQAGPAAEMGVLSI